MHTTMLFWELLQEFSKFLLFQNDYVFPSTNHIEPLKLSAPQPSPGTGTTASGRASQAVSSNFNTSTFTGGSRGISAGAVTNNRSVWAPPVGDLPSREAPGLKSLTPQ
ncbi:hypothetical protein RRG08_040878 [Elysia crispata]|uniref:Uncharacterized protein n=1 Tax=Elysia crispata TaxID=231223 RepID=A0AAE1B040_9GAST|nr:hypothetical protein RRG08_040878 [Elysia crispata]